MSEWKQRQLERQARFWAQVRLGATFTAACEAAGVERHQGYRWRKAAGGRIPPVPRIGCGRYLSLPERLQIADLRLAGKGVRAIALELGRAPSTISRELNRNQPPQRARRLSRTAGYAPYAAHTAAQVRARRPKPSKLEDRELARLVEARLRLRWSPQQISADLAALHPNRAELRVCHETIYQSLFVQGRGHLRADLHKQLRTGRAVRRPRGTLSRGQAVTIPNPISISERPAEATDRAVPGHWEGDCATRSRTNMSGLTGWRAADDEAVGAVTGPCPYDPSPPLTCDTGNGVVRSSGESPRTSVPSGSYRQGEDRTGEVT